jgi:hypothetical protein
MAPSAGARATRLAQVDEKMAARSATQKQVDGHRLDDQGGRVIEVFSGQDGPKVQAGKAVFTRPVAKLCILRV